ncbi:hypothetical protein [Oleiharenicola sp. Vm1]|uniref:hypothetical protein n=1 Tax=Oleiharenicola sp. Vm1 TaxID=3398393 RepID=UPI0039F59FC8
MLPTPLRRRSGLRAVLSAACLLAISALAPAQEKLLTPDEVRRIDRENEFWRALHADEDADASLARLRRRGANAEELAWFAPRLEALWHIDVPREWGWLRPEQVAAIKEVDRAFVPRLRAARLRAATGIEIDPAHRGESLLLATSRWQRAVLRTLDYDQIGEFRLMNSPSAQRTARHFEDVPLTDDERRTIYDWQREFEASAGPDGRKQRAGQRDARLDHWRRIRDLIGDDRFAVYLASAEPKFARMHDALGEEIDAATALDAWWIREQFWGDYEKPRGFAVPTRAVAARAEERLRQRLGESLFARYVASPDAKWLNDFRLQVSGGPRKPGARN